MPRRAKGPRLYRDPKRGNYVIRDGSRFIRTGTGELGEAEKVLAQYIGHKHKPTPSSAPMIADVLAVYGEEVAPHRRTAGMIAYNIAALLRWWGYKTVADISPKTCREYAATKGNNSGAGMDLKRLKSAVRYWHESEYGPLAAMPRFWRPDEPPPRERWLARIEAARLLKAAKPYLHIRRLILLGLYTGSRPGVILKLEWGQVDLGAGVLIRTRDAQARNKRAPRVKLGRRILGHLRRWNKLDGGKGPICYFEDEQHRRRFVADPHTAWRKVVAAAGLKGVTRHTLRHTRATWMAQKGVPLWEAAGFLGMSVRTLEKTYAHHDPDHQEHAANI